MVNEPAGLTFPAVGTSLPGSTVTFTWSPGIGFDLQVGTCLRCADIFDMDDGLALSATVTGLPTDGRTVFVRLTSSRPNGVGYAEHYEFRAAD